MPTKENPKNVSTTFGKILIEARTSKGLTQRELAKDAGVDRSFIHFLEHGHSQPTLTVLLSIEKALDLPYGELSTRTARLLNRG